MKKFISIILALSLMVTMCIPVFADVTNGVTYFGNTEFEKSGTTWTASKYWPIQNTLDFTVYAPYVEGASYSDNVLTIPVANNTTDQTDWLYGETRYIGKSKDDGSISTKLNHGLSKITVKVWADVANVYDITSLKLNETNQAGTLTVTYDNTSGAFSKIESAVSNPASLSTHEFIEETVTVNVTSSTAAKELGSYYVFPSDDTSFTVTYNVAGGASGLTADIPLTATWDCGKHYTYVVKFTANKIIFDKPVINAWDTTDNTKDVTVQ